MEMRSVRISDGSGVDSLVVTNERRVWQCRNCEHRIDWDRSRDGRLLEDVQARYNAKLRGEWEQRREK